MAELASVRVEDFRAFREASFEVKSNGLMLVTGPNNSGKSALLSSLDVVAGVGTPPTMLHAEGVNAHVWARFLLDDAEKYSLLGDTTSTPELIQRGVAKWAEWEFVNFGSQSHAIAFRIAWLDEDPLLVARKDVDGAGNWDAYFPTVAISEWRGGELQRFTGSGVSDTLERLAGTQFNQSARSILPEWRATYFHFSHLRQVAGRSYALASVPIVPQLSAAGDNLPAVLLHMITNNEKAWRELSSIVRQIVPGVGSIAVPVIGQQYEVVFNDDAVDHRHNLKDLGSGVEQILMALVVGLTQIANVVVLEEPETGLHPAAQRALLGLLQEWSKDRLFISSTHSATMLDWTSPETVILAVTRSGLESSVSEVANERADVLRGLGVRLSDVLSAERILIIEGPTDKDIIETWFSDLIKDPRLVVLPGGGGANARHADLLVSWLDRADALGQRKVLYVRDRDELTAEALEKLERSDNIYVLPCRELENLLLDFRAIADVINREREKSGREPVIAEAVAVRAKEIADSLKEIVVLKRVMAELAEPLRYVDNKLRSELAKKFAGKEELIEAVLGRVPTKRTIRSKINQVWKKQTIELNNIWDHDWMNLAPGADVLSLLWNDYLGRGYSKGADGLAIARTMARPIMFEEIIAKFLKADES